MNKKFYFSLENAKESFNEGKLLDWIQNYLRNEGSNIKLADHLIKIKPKILSLISFPLNKLTRIVGPEKGMQYQEQNEKWEQRISGLIKAINMGVNLPPLIVTDIWNDNLSIADGGHRHEAFHRQGIDKYWTIFLFTKDKNIKLISEI